MLHDVIKIHEQHYTLRYNIQIHHKFTMASIKQSMIKDINVDFILFVVAKIKTTITTFLWIVSSHEWRKRYNKKRNNYLLIRSLSATPFFVMFCFCLVLLHWFSFLFDTLQTILGLILLIVMLSIFNDMIIIE